MNVFSVLAENIKNRPGRLSEVHYIGIFYIFCQTYWIGGMCVHSKKSLELTEKKERHYRQL